MQVLFDTNVILDVLLKRDPCYPHAAKLWQAVDENGLVRYMTASIATDIYYIARRVGGVEKAKLAIRLCLATFQICAVDRQALELAETMQTIDFEDHVQIAGARLAGLDAIATRDLSGFTSASIPAYSPEQLVKLLNPDE
jgi:predicted nucleic acid-binding protein